MGNCCESNGYPSRIQIDAPPTSKQRHGTHFELSPADAEDSLDYNYESIGLLDPLTAKAARTPLTTV